MTVRTCSSDRGIDRPARRSTMSDRSPGGSASPAPSRYRRGIFMPGASPGSMFRSHIAYYPPGTFLGSRLQARAVHACPPDPVPARTSVGQANQTVDVAAIAVGGGPQGSTTQVCGRFKLQREATRSITSIVKPSIDGFPKAACTNRDPVDVPQSKVSNPPCLLRTTLRSLRVRVQAPEGVDGNSMCL
jgi:hypothetical protein